jgi:hypothetical protein
MCCLCLNLSLGNLARFITNNLQVVASLGGQPPHRNGHGEAQIFKPNLRETTDVTSVGDFLDWRVHGACTPRARRGLILEKHFI